MRSTCLFAEVKRKWVILVVGWATTSVHHPDNIPQVATGVWSVDFATVGPKLAQRTKRRWPTGGSLQWVNGFAAGGPTVVFVQDGGEQ